MSDLEGTIVINGEIEKRPTVSRGAFCVRPNPKLTTCNILINVSINKAVSIYDSTLKGIVS